MDQIPLKTRSLPTIRSLLISVQESIIQFCNQTYNRHNSVVKIAPPPYKKPGSLCSHN